MNKSDSDSASKQDCVLGSERYTDRPTVIVDNESFIRGAFCESPKRGFESLFRLYYTPLCSHALRFVYRPEVAEDIVSEVFFQFWKSEGYTHVQQTYRAYLYAAVRHRSYNYLRDELTGFRVLLPLDAANLPNSDVSPQTLIEYDETVQRIEKAIHELPSRCQRVFMMSRFESRKNQEIADELSLSLKTVEAHLSKALQQLRQVFILTLLPFFIGTVQYLDCLFYS